MMRRMAVLGALGSCASPVDTAPMLVRASIASWKPTSQVVPVLRPERFLGEVPDATRRRFPCSGEALSAALDAAATRATARAAASEARLLACHDPPPAGAGDRWDDLVGLEIARRANEPRGSLAREALQRAGGTDDVFRLYLLDALVLTGPSGTDEAVDLALSLSSDAPDREIRSQALDVAGRSLAHAALSSAEEASLERAVADTGLSFDRVGLAEWLLSSAISARDATRARAWADILGSVWEDDCVPQTGLCVARAQDVIDALAEASRLDGGGLAAERVRAAGLDCLDVSDVTTRVAEGTAVDGSIAWSSVVPDDPDQLACLDARTRAVTWDGTATIRLEVTRAAAGPHHH